MPTADDLNQLPSNAKNRSDWVDVAKAVSIILVVFHHAIPRIDNIPLIIFSINDALLAFRMPVFFFISGLFIAKAVNLNFIELLYKRIIPLMYLYILWALFKITILNVGNKILNEPFTARYIDLFVAPPATLWFIYALVIFTVVAWMARKLPPYIALLIAVSIYIVGFGEGLINGMPFHLQLARMLVWFVAGYAFSAQAFLFAKNTSPLLGVLIAPWLGAAYLLIGGHAHSSWWTMGALSVTGIFVGICLAVSLSKTFLNNALVYIGKNTLPIYVTHFLIVYPAGVIHPSSSGTALAFLMIVWVFSIVIPLFGRAIALKMGMRWLFECPASFLRPLKSWNMRLRGGAQARLRTH